MKTIKKTMTLRELRKRLSKHAPWYKKIYYTILRTRSNFLCFMRDIMNGVDRFMYGVGREDAANLDVFLADVIVRSMNILRKNRYNTLRCTKGKKAKRIYADIIKGFVAYAQSKSLKFIGSEKQYKQKMQQFKIAMRLFCKYYKELWL